MLSESAAKIGGRVGAVESTAGSLTRCTIAPPRVAPVHVVGGEHEFIEIERQRPRADTPSDLLGNQAVLGGAVPSTDLVPHDGQRRLFRVGRAPLGRGPTVVLARAVCSCERIGRRRGRAPAGGRALPLNVTVWLMLNMTLYVNTRVR